MTKFIWGFLLGAIIMIVLGIFWGLMPDFLGGRWDISQPNPITSNPFILHCDKLLDSSRGLGSVEAAVTKDGVAISDLVVNLSVERPPLATHGDAQPGEFSLPAKACFAGTNQGGIATFKNVPAGTAYIFFNNDPASYPKRFGSANYTITAVEVKSGESAPVAIELSPPK